MHGAFAGVEHRRRLALAAAIDEDLVLAPVGQPLDVRDARRVIELQLDVEAAKAVGLGGEGQVMKGAVVLDHRPGLPLRREPALGAARDQLLAELAHLVPGLGRRVGIEAGLLEQLLVPVEHRGRGVERHRQQLAVGRRIVAVDRTDIGLGVERLLGIGHQLMHRIDRALGRHHRRGADLEDLHDVRRLLGAEGGDRRGQGLGVRALEDRRRPCSRFCDLLKPSASALTVSPRLPPMACHHWISFCAQAGEPARMRRRPTRRDISLAVMTFPPSGRDGTRGPSLLPCRVIPALRRT